MTDQTTPEIDLGETTEPETTDNEQVLIDAAEEVEEKAEKPEGSPHFVSPAIALGKRNRELRAQFFDLVQPVFELDTLTTDDPRETALSMHAVAGVEKAMRLVCLPAARPAYDKWVKDVEDDVLMQLFAWYMQEFQVGEASTSQG